MFRKVRGTPQTCHSNKGFAAMLISCLQSTELPSRQTSSKFPGISELTINAANVQFKFTNNKPDADSSILVPPRNVDAIWEMLHVALAAATSDDARSLIIPVYYGDEHSRICCAG